MNWNWACEQLLKGEKVWENNGDCYLYFDNTGTLCVYFLETKEHGYCVLSESFMSSKIWEFYEKPKKWTKKQREYAKALITFGGEYVVCNKNGDVCVHANIVYKHNDKWSWEYGIDNYISDIFGFTMKQIFGNKVKWEDEEPTRLQDIVDSEVEE